MQVATDCIIIANLNSTTITLSGSSLKHLTNFSLGVFPDVSICQHPEVRQAGQEEYTNVMNGQSTDCLVEEKLKGLNDDECSSNEKNCDDTSLEGDQIGEDRRIEPVVEMSWDRRLSIWQIL